MLVHKYIGPGDSQGSDTPSTPSYQQDAVGNIQDLLFLENRDRKYSQDIYQLRGIYNVNDIDFNLSQFGLFLQNDVVFITFHINDTVEKLARKIIPGDVIELPHLKDEHGINDLQFALKRFYVIEDVNRAAEGFSALWYPHLYRAKCVPLVDSQEFKDILDNLANEEDFQGAWNPNIQYQPNDVVLGSDGEKYIVTEPVQGVDPAGEGSSQYYRPADTLRELMSTYEKEMQITEAVLNQAEADAPEAGYDTQRFYTLQPDEDGRAEIVGADLDTQLIPSTDAEGNILLDENGEPIYMAYQADTVYASPEGNAYDGYLTDDAIPANGAPFSSGISFPLNPVEGQFALRTDYLPNRLFRFDGKRWIKIEDDVRMTMSNLGPSDVEEGARFEGKQPRSNQKSTFINNNNVNTINGKEVKEKQSLSQALKPKADE